MASIACSEPANAKKNDRRGFFFLSSETSLSVLGDQIGYDHAFQRVAELTEVCQAF